MQRRTCGMRVCSPAWLTPMLFQPKKYGLALKPLLNWVRPRRRAADALGALLAASSSTTPAAAAMANAVVVERMVVGGGGRGCCRRLG